jgi:hypothetical protein
VALAIVFSPTAINCDDLSMIPAPSCHTHAKQQLAITVGCWMH